MPGQHFINFQTFQIPFEIRMNSEPSGAVYIKRHGAEPTEEELALVRYSIVHTGHAEFRRGAEGRIVAILDQLEGEKQCHAV